MINTFKCAMCHQIFRKAWSDQEALEETRQHFGDVALEDLESVCDDCYRAIDPATHPRELAAYHGDRCPETGELDCQRCSGEFCEQHGTQPCGCDTAERHQRADKTA